jgi:hypothetical protein
MTALNNALRHGKADRILISLSQQDRQVVLEVSDNGIGFDPTVGSRAGPMSGGMGLRIMNYRAAMIGGAIHIQRRKRQGMLVRCTVPREGS